MLAYIGWKLVLIALIATAPLRNSKHVFCHSHVLIVGNSVIVGLMLRPEGVASRDVILLSICKAVSHMDNPLIDISDTSNSKKLPSTEFKWHAILNFIQHTPGCHLRKIKKELNISMGTVQYQLNRLEKRGIITSSKRGFYWYYFPVAIKGFDKDILEILAHETLSQIILFVIEQKEPTQSEIVKGVGISHASINWHMQRLIALNIIEEIKDGRYKRYRIIGNHERWINMLAFMKNYYPSLWNKWSSRITEFFL